MSRASKVTLKLHQLLRLPRNIEFKISAKNPWIASANIQTIRRQSEDNPSMIRGWNRHPAPAASETLLVPSWRRCLYGKNTRFRAPAIAQKLHVNAAPATKSDTPTSPNIAPATKNGSHDLILSNSLLYYSLLYCTLLDCSLLCYSLLY